MYKYSSQEPWWSRVHAWCDAFNWAAVFNDFWDTKMNWATSTLRHKVLFFPPFFFSLSAWGIYFHNIAIYAAAFCLLWKWKCPLHFTWIQFLLEVDTLYVIVMIHWIAVFVNILPRTGVNTEAGALVWKRSYYYCPRINKVHSSIREDTMAFLQCIASTVIYFEQVVTWHVKLS